MPSSRSNLNAYNYWNTVPTPLFARTAGRVSLRLLAGLVLFLAIAAACLTWLPCTQTSTSDFSQTDALDRVTQPASAGDLITAQDILAAEYLLAPTIARSLPSLREGSSVRLVIHPGLVADGLVTLVLHETGGWLRVAGEISGPIPGSFAFGTDGSAAGGLIQFPTRRLAYELTPEGTFHERRLGDLVCLPLPRPDFESATPPSRTRAASEVPPLLSSRPAATAVLYLDFDGQTVTDPLWNNGRTITAKAPNLTNTDITAIWRRVKEDFWPFDVDVTTDLSRYTGAPVRSRMRCIITPTDTAAPGAGGVAYVDSFSEAGTAGFSNDIPCWVFNSSVNGISEAIAHEIGHTLGLRHDGRTNPAEEYYAGAGSGATGWAPIMGVSYYKSLTQWSKGEYLNANRTEDDLAIISGSANGFGYVADEAGGTLAAAASLGVTDTEVNQPGIITRASDIDVFVFTTGAGPVDIAANPAPSSPNLDILLELLDETGAPLTTSNPSTSLPASIATNVPGGIYYLRIRGTGAGNVLTTGYTAYGSIGEYTLTGTIPGGTTAPIITSAGAAEGEVGIPFSYQIAAANSPDSYAVTGTLPDGLSLDPDTGLISGTPTEAVVRSLTLEATNVHGTGTKPFTLTIQASGTPSITSAGLAHGTINLGFGFQLTATHTPGSYAVAGTLPAGVTLNTLTGLLSGTPSEAGDFPLTVSATNANGTGTAQLTLNISNTIIALNQALDVPGRTFTNNGATAWQGQNSVTFDPVDAAQSAPIADNATSAMQTTVTGPVTISFHYRVDSEQDHDLLEFFVDNAPQLSVSGFVDWSTFSLAIGPGSHTLRWEYRKDASGRAGADAAWVDVLGITSATAPVITSSNFAAARVGVPFNYQIAATNNPTTFGLAGTLPDGLIFTAGTSGLISGTPSEGGVFSATMSASNAGGTGTRELVISVESGPLDLTGALDQADLLWTNTGTATWEGEIDVTHDGVDAGAATNVGHNESAVMETDIEGPASLRFFWRVSSERDYDHLSFSIDGLEYSRISGEVDWQLKSFPIPAGVHRIVFRYRRDASNSGGQNGAWVDEVSVFPREGLPGSDSFAGAQALTGTHAAIATNNLDATIEPGETGPFGSSYGHSLWWTWTAPESGRVVASTVGSSFDTILAIYTGTSLSDLSFVASNDDASRRLSTSRVKFDAIAGTTYFITIGGFGDETGFIDFDIRYTGRGAYIGIVLPDAGADKIAGLIQLTLSDSLAYTGRLLFEAGKHTLRGSLASGTDSFQILRPGGLAPLDLTLSTDLFSGDNTVSGTMTVDGQGYHFTARRRLDREDLSDLAPGAYTVLLEPATAGSTVAFGAGYGRAIVTARGDVRFSGFLADGQRATQGGALTFGHIWPCYLAPYRRIPGALAGEATFDPVAANNFTGALRWKVENVASGVFSEDVALTGTFYFRPAPSVGVLTVTPHPANVQLTFSHRDTVADPADPLVTLDTANQFSGLPAGFALKLNTRTGLFSGQFPAPVSGARQSFGGALLQSENRGAGLFDSFTGHGRVDMVPVP